MASRGWHGRRRVASVLCQRRWSSNTTEMPPVRIHHLLSAGESSFIRRKRLRRCCADSLQSRVPRFRLLLTHSAAFAWSGRACRCESAVAAQWRDNSSLRSDESRLRQQQHRHHRRGPLRLLPRHRVAGSSRRQLQLTTILHRRALAGSSRTAGMTILHTMSMRRQLLARTAQMSPTMARSGASRRSRGMRHSGRDLRHSVAVGWHGVAAEVASVIAAEADTIVRLDATD